MGIVGVCFVLLLSGALLVEATERHLLADHHAWQLPMRSELVVVMASSVSRNAIVRATQKSRKGVRTFVVVDKGPPLDGNGVAKKQISLRISTRPQVFGAYSGEGSRLPPSQMQELRIALSPFLANATLGPGSYKWILFGHDDTVWLVENVIQLLAGLDPNEPYLITDNTWFDSNRTGTAIHPSPEAPFCLPCRKEGYADIRMHQEGGRWRCILNNREAPLGCPCTRANLAQNVVGKHLLDPETVDFKEPKQKASFRLHIGGGMIISRGLMALESFDRVQSWMKAGVNMSADELLTGAVWELLGMAPTKPGYDVCRPGETTFDPGWETPRKRAESDWGEDGGNDPFGVVDRLEGALNDDSRCDKACNARLNTIVSVHVRQKCAAEDLPRSLKGTTNETPRFNATVLLIQQLTDRAEHFLRRRWAAEQAYIAAGN